MINNITIMGRITADPELKKTPSEISVAKFTVAVERADKERTTDFLDVVAWRSTAEFITKYFSKGDMIAVVGSLQARKYEDKNGQKRTAYEIVASNVSFCGSKKSEDNKSENPESPKPDFEEVGTDDDLPF